LITSKPISFARRFNCFSNRAEIRRLQEENKRLRMERDILKKATALFARESP
jgi:transposase-like protein